MLGEVIERSQRYQIGVIRAGDADRDRGAGAGGRCGAVVVGGGDAEGVGGVSEQRLDGGIVRRIQVVAGGRFEVEGAVGARLAPVVGDAAAGVAGGGTTGECETQVFTAGLGIAGGEGAGGIGEGVVGDRVGVGQGYRGDTGGVVDSGETDGGGGHQAGGLAGTARVVQTCVPQGHGNRPGTKARIGCPGGGTKTDQGTAVFRSAAVIGDGTRDLAQIPITNEARSTGANSQCHAGLHFGLAAGHIPNARLMHLTLEALGKRCASTNVKVTCIGTKGRRLPGNGALGTARGGSTIQINRDGGPVLDHGYMGPRIQRDRKTCIDPNPIATGAIGAKRKLNGSIREPGNLETILLVENYPPAISTCTGRIDPGLQRETGGEVQGAGVGYHHLVIDTVEGQ